MPLHYSDAWLTVYAGDARDELRRLDAGSVHAVVTSPPYWGLRDYGGTWEGGDPACAHTLFYDDADNKAKAGLEGRVTRGDKSACLRCGATRVGNLWGGDPEHAHAWGPLERGKRKDILPADVTTLASRAGVDERQQGAATNGGQFCACGAWRGDFGLEPTPDLYVEHLVEIMREVWRVLRDDGTLWLNLGDSYIGGKGSSGGRSEEAQRERARAGASLSRPAAEVGGPGRVRPQDRVPPGLKPKDLAGIPWRAAFALQADGWWLRRDVVWAKPNPMPESVEDRPTSSHEYLFMLTKAGEYYYDHAAVRERGTTGSWAAMPPIGGVKHAEGNGNATYSGNRPASDGRRNLRSVWSIATVPYPGAHFATFPPELPRRCIAASTSERGVCSTCGTPWRRLLEKVTRFEDGSGKAGRAVEDTAASGKWHRGEAGNLNLKSGPVVDLVTVGWAPTCACAGEGDDWQVIDTPTGGGDGRPRRRGRLATGRRGLDRQRQGDEGRAPMYRWQQRAYARQLRASSHIGAMAEEAGPAFAHYIRTDISGARPVPPDLLAAWLERGWLVEPEPPRGIPGEPVPATVLDPFAGSGTVAMVAAEMSRRAVLVDLNPDYIDQQLRRNVDVPLGLVVEVVGEVARVEVGPGREREVAPSVAIWPGRGLDGALVE